MAGTKKDSIDYRIAKSQEALEDALILSQHARWNGSANRFYYSCFHLIDALLYKNDLYASTHSGTKTLFNQHFIKTEILPKEFGKLYNELFEWRQEGDYTDFVNIEAEMLIPQIEKIKSFHEILFALINT